MKAYHNDPAVKSAILAQLVGHRKADEIVKGQYWEGGKGCAVGCTLHTSDHAEYETRFGIPQMLAHLEDRIFEGLPNGVAKAWPERFMGTIEPGADLSRVGWQFLHWLITDESMTPGISDPLVRNAVKQCADVLVPLMKGGAVDEDAAWSAARSAVRSAESAARSAASAAWSANNAARSAAWSAENAESAASAARSAAWSAAYIRMADKLIELICQQQPER